MKVAIAPVHRLNPYLREHLEMLDKRHHPSFEDFQPNHPEHAGHTVLFPFPDGDGYQVKTSEGNWRDLPLDFKGIKVVELKTATEILLDAKLRPFARLDQIELKG